MKDTEPARKIIDTNPWAGLRPMASCDARPTRLSDAHRIGGWMCPAKGFIGPRTTRRTPAEILFVPTYFPPPSAPMHVVISTATWAGREGRRSGFILVDMVEEEVKLQGGMAEQFSILPMDVCGEILRAFL